MVTGLNSCVHRMKLSFAWSNMYKIHMYMILLEGLHVSFCCEDLHISLWSFLLLRISFGEN